MHHHNRFFKYFLNKEINEIYITLAIKNFSLALISIFIPIYLLQQGFTLNNIFLFYAIFSISIALTAFFVLKLVSRVGIKHGMLLSMFFLIIYYFMLQFVTNNSLNWVFFVAPIVAGIYSSLFWSNFHIDFAVFSSKKIRTQQLGLACVFAIILAAIGPALGGFLLSYMGFNYLFLIAAILLIISSFPLFLTRDNYVHKDFSFKGLKHVLKKADFVSMSGFVGQGMILPAMYFSSGRRLLFA